MSLFSVCINAFLVVLALLSLLSLLIRLLTRLFPATPERPEDPVLTAINQAAAAAFPGARVIRIEETIEKRP